MNKTNLLITGVLLLAVCALAVAVPPVAHFVGAVEDVLKLTGLATICFGVVQLVNLVKAKLSK